MSGPPRLASLDSFRGLAIAGMVLVNNPGSWDHVYRQLDHAAWNGCTFTDLVFPFFLFAAGLAMTLSLARRAGAGADRPALLRVLLRRAALLFLIGVALNLIPAFRFATLRIPGVLQRIALCVALAAPVVLWGRWRAALVAGVVLCAVYLGLQLWVPVRGIDGLVGAGRLQPGLDFGSWLDRAVFGGHLWSHAKTWDPEGLVSTLPATASLLSGVLAGRFMAAGAPTRKAPWLLLAGILLLGVGAGLDRLGLPINKNLWTPSYVLFTDGWALLFLAAFHAAVDEAPPRFREAARKACLPLTIYGMNALFLFVFSGLVARLLQSVAGGGIPLKGRMYGALAALPWSAENASLAFAVLFNLAMFAVAWALWRRKWFVKL